MAFQTDDCLSYVCGSSEVALLDKCIGEVLDDSANKHPDEDCLISCHQKKRYSYRQFLEQVSLTARGLLHLGVKKGDRVGIWSPNCAEWVITQFATAKVGAILVNINPANRAFELEHVLRQSETQTLLFAEGTEVGRSLCERDMADSARRLLALAREHSCRVILPEDAVVAARLAPEIETRVDTLAYVLVDLTRCHRGIGKGPHDDFATVFDVRGPVALRGDAQQFVFEAQVANDLGRRGKK